MCNLYSITKTQDAIRQLFRIRRDRAGNLPPLPGIFPDMAAPIIRKGEDGERELGGGAAELPAFMSPSAGKSGCTAICWIPARAVVSSHVQCPQIANWNGAFLAQ
jgi:putative SOS response-associated peptidase YedK